MSRLPHILSPVTSSSLEKMWPGIGAAKRGWGAGDVAAQITVLIQGAALVAADRHPRELDSPAMRLTVRNTGKAGSSDRPPSGLQSDFRDRIMT